MIRCTIRSLTERSTVSRHERLRKATLYFLAMWLLAVIGSISAPFLLLNVQALLLLHHTVSLASVVVSQGVSTRTGGQDTYPLSFGYGRLSTLIRLGGAIFLAFGCFATLVESLHRVVHHHYASPLVLLLSSVSHWCLLYLYRGDLLLVDRVVGRGADQHGVCAEEQLVSEMCRNSLANRHFGGGEVLWAAAPPPDGSSARGDVNDKEDRFGFHFSLRGSWLRRMRRWISGSFWLFLMPMTGIVTSCGIIMFDLNWLDAASALTLCAVYCYHGYQQGKHLAWVVLNNALRDPAKLQALERVHRDIKLVDGVLQLQSTSSFFISPDELMTLVRVRVMSGASAGVVAQTVRRMLLDVSQHVYVECFYPSGIEVISGGGVGGFIAPSLKHAHHDDHHKHNDCHGHSHQNNNSDTAGNAFHFAFDQQTVKAAPNRGESYFSGLSPPPTSLVPMATPRPMAIPFSSMVAPLPPPPTVAGRQLNSFPSPPQPFAAAAPLPSASAFSSGGGVVEEGHSSTVAGRRPQYSNTSAAATPSRSNFPVPPIL